MKEIPDGDIWSAFEYELAMFIGTSKLLTNYPGKLPDRQILRNVLSESRILHTRILADILTDRSGGDDFSLADLDINFPPSVYIEEIQQELKDAYGSSREKNSPCWTINKMLAHPTKWRTDSFDWGATINKIEPIMYRLIHLIAEYCDKPEFKEFIQENY